MPDEQRTTCHGFMNRAIDRRTMLTGTTAALFGALAWPSLAGARSVSTAVTRAAFDPKLARSLQAALDEGLHAPSSTISGAILHVQTTARGSFTGTSGRGRMQPTAAIAAEDRFRAGSVVKPFVSARILQLVEDGRLTLDSTLPDVLPASVVARFPTASHVTLSTLLGHRSGLPEWDTPELDAVAARHPRRIWTAAEFLDRAAARPPLFAPGTRYSYSNTNYTLAGLVIENATGRAWRDEVTDRVIAPLGLQSTWLPDPGNGSLGGPHVHGYVELDGKLLETSNVDPSMAGPAGGHALVTTVGDLVRFFDALLAGRLFRRPGTLKAMLSFKPASGEPGQIGYGLGLFQRAFPGGLETIDHLGGTAGYMTYVARLPRHGVTMAVALADATDPSPVLLPVLQALSTTHR
jgi:D-alanyl-D-alanine carboxypeptidase